VATFKTLPRSSISAALERMRRVNNVDEYRSVRYPSMPRNRLGDLANAHGLKHWNQPWDGWRQSLLNNDNVRFALGTQVYLDFNRHDDDLLGFPQKGAFPRAFPRTCVRLF